LKLIVIGARNLTAKDKSGTSDPYVKVYLDGVKMFKSKPVSKNLNPHWNETKFIDDVTPQSKIEFRVYNHDKMGGHGFLGECTITSSDITEALEKEAVLNKWYTLQKRKKKDVVSGDINISLQMVSKPDPNFNPKTYVAPPPKDVPPPPVTGEGDNLNQPMQNETNIPPKENVPPLPGNYLHNENTSQTEPNPPKGNIPPPQPPPFRNNPPPQPPPFRNNPPPTNDVPPKTNPPPQPKPRETTTRTTHTHTDTPSNPMEELNKRFSKNNEEQQQTNTQTQQQTNTQPQQQTNTQPPKHAPPRQLPPPKPKEQKAVALYDFIPEHDYELGLFPNDEIIILEDQGEWYRGRKTDGTEGFFPSNYVQIIQ